MYVSHIQIPETTTPKGRVRPGGAQVDGAQSVISAFTAGSKYDINSKEQQKKEQALALWIARKALPASTAEDEDFQIMMQAFDKDFKKLHIPKRTKMNNLMEMKYNEEKVKWKERLAMAQKISIGMDIWSKKGLTAAFLAITASFYCTQENKAQLCVCLTD